MIGGNNIKFRLIAVSEEEAHGEGYPGTCVTPAMFHFLSMGVLCIMIYIGGFKENFTSHLVSSSYFD